MRFVNLLRPIGVVLDTHITLIALTAILFLGIGSQWLAERLRIPSILPLLFTGVLIGPVTGYLKPDALLGDLLLPLVSLSIAVILFEGAMTLHLSDLNKIGRPLLMLLTVGVGITWVLSALSAHYVLQFEWKESILLGSILTVTGPTVVGPLLQHIRPIGNVGALARWEGIVIDPVGAVLAVLTFSAAQEMHSEGLMDITIDGAIVFVRTFVIGSAIGIAAAMVLRLVLKNHWVSDHLDSPLVLSFVVLTFTLANVIHHEAGLVAVTVMGVALANQRAVSVQRILAFKENLTVLLISCLFVVLTARLDMASFLGFGWRGIAFLAAMVLLVRPVSVMLSTGGFGMPWNERLFLSWLAPRGIVAAAVGSVFASELPHGEQFVAAVFLVIVGTVIIYGLTAAQVARKLNLSVANPQGVLMIGAHAGARAIALALANNGILVRVVDTNRDNIRTAQMEGLPTFFGSVFSEELHEIDLGGLGRIMALTGNGEVNLLAMHRGEELFERKECYRLSLPASRASRSEVGRDIQAGRVLFSETATHDELDRRFAAGHTLKTTLITEEFTYANFREQYPEALLMFSIEPSGQLIIVTDESTFEPAAGQTIIAMVA